MVLNAAVQMLREADDLKQKILKFKSGTSMLQEQSLWATQQQLQNVYQKVLVLDLDYALDKKVEQDLWNVGFKQQIEALQAISKDRKNPLRSEGQAMLSWVLQAAAGFYLCLLHQICTTFKLDLPFRRRASLLGWVEGWGCGAGSPPPPAAARYICQHCLVHLGDLARYRHQLRQAHTFYRHAVVVWASSGQPYNQLALVSWRRGRRLSAVYWHVRSLQVRAPFPPAPTNLARTLALCAATQNKDLPVIPGVTIKSSRESTPATILPATLDAHTYVTEFIRAVHYIHTTEQLETASELVKKLNSSLTPLVATDGFESMTLIKMSCILIWLVHATTEDLPDRSALSDSEQKAAALSEDLCAATILALLLPNYTSQPNDKRLPSLKVWLQWLVHHSQQMKTAAWSSRLQLWPAFAHTFNLLADVECNDFINSQYDTVPLPEDEELQGFLPLEQALKGLKFASHTAWDTYGGRIPDIVQTDGDHEVPSDITPSSLNEPELENKVRAYRILQLGKQLADICTEQLSHSMEDSKLHFTATAVCGEQLTAALAELSLAAASQPPPTDDVDEDSDYERAPTAPTVISEADFRERFREKRVGILKPQGSLERAREERAMATQEDIQEVEPIEEIVKLDDKKEARKQRVNIAMAAIMRKQEESNKQVKFVSPPPTPDSTADASENKDDKPKVIQPKPMKSLANLPIGRKTGGILSLKDKSAGYPHLVNTDPEPEKKKEERKDNKQVNNSQNSQQKQQNWGPNHPNTFSDQPRLNFQKNYGLQNVGISYNPNYQPPNLNNHGIRLPVVNPKEIDVRTAALQKQNSRQDLFQDGPKLNHPVSGDKRNFLNDLPPRFANQYRYWQAPQEQFSENKFREDNASASNMFSNQQPRANWMSPQTPDFQQTMSWWKPDNPQNYTNFSNPPPLNMQTNYFNPQVTSNMSNPYQNLSYDPMQNPNMGLNKPDLMTPGYLQPSMSQQMPTLQNLVASPNFSSSLNSFGTYAAPSVGYDSTMYPQFNTNKLSFPPPNMTMPNPQFIGPTKPAVGYQANKDMMEIGSGLGFGQNFNTNMSFNESLGGDGGHFNTDQTGSGGGENTSEPGGSTYSLFSGAPAAAWGQHQSPQSLWSGPGPSPLERLLEQQKQMKPPPPTQ